MQESIQAGQKTLWIVFGVLLCAVFIVGSRVDINEFSLNAFYRNRLSRCYLGATRFPAGERSPQKFTNFDENDDIGMTDLQGTHGPIHLVNCALNMGGSSDLALHTRHSRSFTISPYFTGSSNAVPGSNDKGYRDTEKYSGKREPTLALAISVSGAAASPNMGYHTSPVVAFLLTVFNVRLGWWFPNPRESTFERASPRMNLSYLLLELFGVADDKSDYLMISDGGHFENLAVYELIRRRCGVIIVSDAECDPNLQFEGLGSLIRMCRVDFGATIDIDVSDIRTKSNVKWSGSRCAVGTISYADDSRGYLIYLKASMTGHEDSAILQYQSTHPTFPHESTGNQFYGEDQFESYRCLGKDIAEKVFESVGTSTDIVSEVEILHKKFSPTLQDNGRFSDHAAQLMGIWMQMGSNPDLQIFRPQLEADFTKLWPDESRASLHKKHYICSQMIQLMENVYLDLDLENTLKHPDNIGWVNTFTGWAKLQPVRKSWLLARDSFGERFRLFCERELGFPKEAA